MLFIISPTVSLLFSLMNYKSSYVKNVVWLFIGFFGFTFVVSSEGLDSAVYRNQFLFAYSMKELEFMPYVFAEWHTDYFIYILNYIVSRFTGDYRIFFMFLGLFYGFFYSRNIFYFIEKSRGGINYYALIALVLFVFLVPFWNINGIRFYLATHVFFYGVIQVLLENKKKYILLVFSTIFIHFSFNILVGIFLIYLIFGKYRMMYPLVVFASLFFIDIDIQSLLDKIPSLSGPLDSKIKGYTHKEFIGLFQNYKEAASWFMVLRNDLLNYSILIFLTYLSLVKYKAIKESGIQHLIFPGILFICAGLVFDIIPSMSRLVIVGHLFAAAGIFYYLIKMKPDYWTRRMIPLMSVIFLLYVIVEIRLGFEVLGPGTFVLNPLLAPFFEYKTCFADYYRDLFK
ncbi:MAG: EpsG family protein [Saprospiraceae bacterium]|nr:EpsG family protein [Saprospiraceae bacterium]